MIQRRRRAWRYRWWHEHGYRACRRHECFFPVIRERWEAQKPRWIGGT